MKIKTLVLSLAFLLQYITFMATLQAFEIDKNIKVIAVFAHPDDETWINGTLSLLANKGLQLNVVYATSGNAGHDRSGRNLSGTELAVVRELEAHNALIALDIPNPPIFLRLGDGTLYENIDELQAKIEKIFLELEPNVVITFGPGGVTGSPDHIATSIATARTFDTISFNQILLNIAVSKKRSQNLLTIAKSHGVYKYWPKEQLNNQAINLRINLHEFQTQRQNSPKKHQTQFPEAIINVWDEFVEKVPYEELIIARKRNQIDDHTINALFK